MKNTLKLLTIKIGVKFNNSAFDNYYTVKRQYAQKYVNKYICVMIGKVVNPK